MIKSSDFLPKIIMSVDWSSVWVSYSEGKQPGWFQTYIYNGSSTLDDVEEWMRDYTRYDIGRFMDKLVVTGGSEKEWMELQKLEMFKDMDIVPDIIVPLY